MTTIQNFLDNIVKTYYIVNEKYPLYNKPYPIGIIQNNNIYIYEYNEKKYSYEYIKKKELGFSMTNETSAAFPIDIINNRICCVLGDKIIKSKLNLIYVFHEFLHCYQYETYETMVKQKLKIEKEILWELNYDFCFSNEHFMRYYLKSLKCLQEKNIKEAIILKKLLFKNITIQDIKYITFFEWKEGLARFYENNIRKIMNINENHYYNSPNLDITIFYEYGSLYFDSLYNNFPPTLYNTYNQLTANYDELKMFR